MAHQRDTRTRLDPQVRRESILDAAEAVMRDRSPVGVTFEAVAEAAGVSRALVYNYFGDRSGLLAAVELRCLERLDDALLGGLDPGLAPVDQLRPMARAYVDFARANGVAAWQLLSATGATEHPAVQVARRNRVERLAALWGGSQRATILARAVTGMLEAATVDWFDQDLDEDLVVETVCRALSGGIASAVGARPVEAG